jgi:hypothetical protein
MPSIDETYRINEGGRTVEAINEGGSREYRLAPAWAVPVPDVHRRPGMYAWKIIVPVCPVCKHRHDHSEGGPTIRPILPHIIPPRSPRYRRTICTPYYEMRREQHFVITHIACICLMPPQDELQWVPEELRLTAMTAWPCNAASVGTAADSEVA